MRQTRQGEDSTRQGRKAQGRGRIAQGRGGEKKKEQRKRKSQTWMVDTRVHVKPGVHGAYVGVFRDLEERKRITGTKRRKEERKERATKDKLRRAIDLLVHRHTSNQGSTVRIWVSSGTWRTKKEDHEERKKKTRNKERRQIRSLHRHTSNQGSTGRMWASSGTWTGTSMLERALKGRMEEAVM
jgi:hypothetical protein